MDAEGARAARPGLSLGPLAWIGAVCAAAGALAALGLLPSVALRVAGAWIFLGGMAFPWLARGTEVEASPWKLACFGALLSPLLAACAWTLLALVLPASNALAVTLTLALLSQILLADRHARRERPGAALAATALVAALAVGLVAAMLFQGSAPRVSYHGLLHASLVQAVERGVPPENPWLAGREVSYYWFWHALGALAQRLFGLAPTQALALLNLHAALTLTFALWLLATPFVRSGARCVLAVVLGLLGLNLLGGWTWLLAGAPFDAPRTASELLAVLARAVPRVNGESLWDLRLSFSLSKLGNPSSFPVALALATGGAAAATHAVRHGRAPWPWLTGALQGAALLVNPIVGGATAGCTALAALLAPGAPGVRARVLGALAVGALPGALLALRAAAAGGGGAGLVTFGFDGARLVGGLGPVVLLLLPAALAFRPPADEPRPRERRALRALFVLSACVPLALYPLVTLPEDNQYKLVRLAAVPLAVLAAEGLGAGFAARGWRRAFSVVSGAAAAVGLAASATLGVRAYLAFATIELPLEERPGMVLPVARTGAGGDLAATYRLLRSAAGELGGQPVLVVNPFAEEPEYDGATGSESRRFQSAANLQGHEAAAFSGMSLWCDRRSYLVERDPVWEERLLGMAELFLDTAAPTWSPARMAELRALERPVILLVTAADKRATPGLEAKIDQSGFSHSIDRGTVTLFALRPDEAFALATMKDLR